MAKMQKFKLHFNRVNMQRKDSRIWTVHTSKVCYQVEEVKCYVPLTTTFKQEARQPRAFLSGRGYIHIHDKKAYIHNDDTYNQVSDDEYFEAVNGPN